MAKKEHIERDAFRKLLIDRQITDVFFNNAKREEIGCVVDMLDRLPTADVVEVVRCKDCVHRDPEDRKCEHYMNNNIFIRQDNDYCSYGERKKQQ